ncbi:hypothetical protein HDG32_005505 [Paraburkholderia sp. CI2]|uniref:hypothetical protein n=1 Tax=Paraburkholderia sp. CI2 TaxID=2723093 RepID=UPI00161782E9|nr:hypothetical protein [Paraburkholderia sp. CI2]MBB5469358.1 hypothetical protein [Paraburkholderia sp. CI2]
MNTRVRTQQLYDHAHLKALQYENERLREALRLIGEMGETSTSALTLIDIARNARIALATAYVQPDPELSLAKKG